MNANNVRNHTPLLKNVDAGGKKVTPCHHPVPLTVCLVITIVIVIVIIIVIIVIIVDIFDIFDTVEAI